MEPVTRYRVDIYKIEAGIRNIVRRYSIKRAGMDSTVSYQKGLDAVRKSVYHYFCNLL